MLHVTNRERSIAFYTNASGMREVRRETFPDGQFTLVFLGYGEAATNSVIELTYNWGDDAYDLGTGHGHIALEVEDIHALQEHLQSRGVEILRPAGPMTEFFPVLQKSVRQPPTRHFEDSMREGA